MKVSSLSPRVLLGIIRSWLSRHPDLLSWILLIPIVLMGAGLRDLHHYDWDGFAPLIHPDEYHVGDRVAMALRVPTSLEAYLTSNCPTVDQGAGPSLINPQNPGAPLNEQYPTAHSGCNSLNPRNLPWAREHQYGSLPTTLVRLAVEMRTTYDEITRNRVVSMGRRFSTLADLLALLVVFWLGRHLANRRVALLAALLYAWTPFPIQQSHFFTVDAQATGWGMLTLAFCVLIAEGRRWGYVVAASVCLGLAVASKINMAVLAGIIGLALVQRVWGAIPASTADRWHPLTMIKRWWRVTGRLVGLLIIFIVTTITTLRLAMPDGFESPYFFNLKLDSRFLAAMRAAQNTASGGLDWPPSHQWASRTPWIYDLKNMITWGMGMPLGIAAWAGWAALGIALLRRRAQRWLVLWVWVTGYFLWQGGLLYKPMRYHLPIYAPLVLFAAWGLISLIDAARRAERPRVFQRIPLGRIATSISLVVAVVTILWGWGFSRIYTRLNPRVEAAQWARHNIPPGSRVSSESWDVGLSMDGSIWPTANTEIPAPGEDTRDKLDVLIGVLDNVDYVALTSNRGYGSLQQLPMRFPITINYYRSLFDGTLGFTQIAEFTSYPTFLGIPIPDQHADESWSVYDHPRVTIFRKTSDWSPARARRLLTNSVNLDEIYSHKPQVASEVPTALQLTESRWSSQQQSGTWQWLFGGLANRAPLLAWIVFIELLGLALWGILWRVRLPLPDRGLNLARMLGLLALGWLSWLPASLQISTFSRAWIWSVTLLLLAAGLALIWRERRQMWAWMRSRRRAIVSGQLAYWVALSVLLAIRYFNPDLWHPSMGGEKPMNLAYLTATLKSEVFPPYDPWFAGGYINYYYWGYVLVGTPMKALGLDPSTGFNLALPVLYGLSAQLAWSVGYNLFSPLKRTVQRLERRAVAVGFGAAAAVLLVGNLAQSILYVNVLRVMGNDQLSFSNPEQSSQNIWLAGGNPFADVSRGVSALLEGNELPLRPEWPYWNSTRVIPQTINEFPFFSFLYGDLHAHVIALPLTLLALALLVAVWRSRHRRHLFGLALLLGGVIGALKATNSWDFPTYGLISGIGLIVGAMQQSRGAVWQRRWLLIGATLALFAAGLILPWLSFDRWLATGSANKVELLGGDMRMTIREFFVIYGLWLWALLAYGIVLIRRSFSRAAQITTLNALIIWVLGTLFIGGTLGSAGAPQPGEGKISQIVAKLIMYPLYQQAAVIVFVLPLLLIGLLLLRAALQGRTRPRDRLPIAWATAGLGLLLLTETVVLPAAGRMNVVFKFGYQAWVLFALASAAALPTILGFQPRRRPARALKWPRLLQPLQRRMAARSSQAQPENQAEPAAPAVAATPAPPAQPAVGEGPEVAAHTPPRWAFWRKAAPKRPARKLTPPPRSAIREMWIGVGMLLVMCSVVYPSTATPARLRDRASDQAPYGFDGMAWMEHATWQEDGAPPFSLAPDAAAIRWLRANMVGTPTIIEAATSPYRWNSRIATWTGLPTLIGWDGHQKQQRAPAQAERIIDQRRELLRQIYTAADPKVVERALDEYGVQLIYVGPVERAVYGGDAGVAVFDQLGEPGDWTVIYNEQDVRIYGRTRPTPIPTALPPVRLAGSPASDPVGRITLRTPITPPAPVDGVADWPWLAEHQLVAVVLWWLLLTALGLLAWPVSLLALRSHGVAAWALSRTLGLLLAGWLIWFPVSLGLWSYTRNSVLGALGALALLSAIALRYGAARRLRQVWAVRRRALLLTELVMVAIFAALTWLRAANPDLWHPVWGGEKPFEIGFLNAVLRGPSFPPADPFFSGGSINYYYYGLFLVSWPMKLLGLAPAVGVQLALAMVGALAAGGAWGVGLIFGRRLRSAALALVAVVVLGNLAGALPVAGSSGLPGALKGLQACDAPGAEPRPGCGAEVPFPQQVWDALTNGQLDGLSTRLGSGYPWFWGPSRVTTTPELTTINEFPVWSLIFADLHPHLIALPIVLLAIGLAGELLRRRRRQTTLLTLALVPWVLGALIATNAWDVPTMALLIVGVLVLRAYHSAAGSWRTRLLTALGWIFPGLVVIGLSALVYAPFLGAYQPPVSGVWPVRIGTALMPWLIIHGLFGLIILAGSFLPRRPRPEPASRAWHDQYLTRGLIAFGMMMVAVGMFRLQHARGLEAILEASFGVRVVVIILLALLMGRLWAWRGVAPGLRGVFALATLGAAVALGVEMVFIRDHLAPMRWSDGPGNAERMNTVFKFGFQVWVLWALAAALLLPYVLRQIRRVSAVLQGAALALLTLLVGAALIFPVFGPISRAGMRFPTPPAGLTLDGLAFMETGAYDYKGTQIQLGDDRKAIGWLLMNIKGRPILLQSEQEFYREYGVRVAANTGLPTVIGALHAGEMRPGDLVGERVGDVQRIYSTTAVTEAQWLLYKYRVQYVYVGPLERLRDPVGVQKFATMAGLRQVYGEGRVTIYQVTDELESHALRWRPGTTEPPRSTAGLEEQLLVAEENYLAEPRKAGFAFEYGRMLWLNGRSDEAIAVLNSAITQHPNDVGMHHVLGDVLVANGRFDEGIAMYEKAYSITSTPENLVKVGIGYLDWAKVDESKLTLAERTFRQAATTKPEFADPHLHLGDLYRTLNQNDQARAEYQEYLRLAPPDAVQVKDVQRKLETLQD